MISPAMKIPDNIFAVMSTAPLNAIAEATSIKGKRKTSAGLFRNGNSGTTNAATVMKKNSCSETRQKRSLRGLTTIAAAPSADLSAGVIGVI
ncbi:MAG: hypothetical protein WCK16_00305 [Candidatus Moraniibacteriota bacterium]